MECRKQKVCTHHIKTLCCVTPLPQVDLYAGYATDGLVAELARLQPSWLPSSWSRRGPLLVMLR